MHRDTEVIPNPRENRVLHANDRLLCFGRLESMRDMIPARRRRRAKVRKLPEHPAPRRRLTARSPGRRRHGSPGAAMRVGSTGAAGVGTVRAMTTSSRCRTRSTARRDRAAVAKRTPVITSVALSGRSTWADRGEVVLKAENLQRTGSFKIRGAINKVASLGTVARTRRHHRQRREPRPGARVRRRHFGVPCEIVVPVGAPVNKIEACRSYGATVIEHGAALKEAVALSMERADASGDRPSARRSTTSP